MTVCGSEKKEPQALSGVLGFQLDRLCSYINELTLDLARLPKGYSASNPLSEGLRKPRSEFFFGMPEKAGK